MLHKLTPKCGPNVFRCPNKVLYWVSFANNLFKFLGMVEYVGTLKEHYSIMIMTSTFHIEVKMASSYYNNLNIQKDKAIYSVELPSKNENKKYAYINNFHNRLKLKLRRPP